MNAKEFFKIHTGYKHFMPAFEELARRVGKTLEELELKSSEDRPENYGWCYDDYTWTHEEEQDFAEWLVEYFYNNQKKFSINNLSKKHIREYEVPYWLLMYSWRYK